MANYIVANPNIVDSGASGTDVEGNTVEGVTVTGLSGAVNAADSSITSVTFQAGRLTAITTTAAADVEAFVVAGLGVFNATVVISEDVRKNIGFLFESDEFDIVGGRPA